MYNKLYIYFYDLYSPVSSFFLCVCVCVCASICGMRESNHGQTVCVVTPSMPGKLNSTCVLVLLFIFKLHFLNTTIVPLMYSVEYTYQGFIQWEATLGSPLELWELNRNEHFGSIYF